MPPRTISVRGLVLTVLALGIGTAYAQSADDGAIVVRPARVPAAGAVDQANLPQPPPGPIESRVLPLPETGNLRTPRESRHVPPTPGGAASAKTIAVISFDGASPNLTDSTKAELEQIAKRIANQRLRQIELRAFAAGGDLESRKIALARALVVRAYLVDLGVKLRIEVGSFSGEGRHVEILAP